MDGYTGVWLVSAWSKLRTEGVDDEGYGIN
jgi:hypothetical protein